MPAKDVFHDVVKKALMKQDWIITDDPLTLRVGGINLYVDLGAEKLITAEKESEKIAIEVKSFIGKTYLAEFHQAVGQFIHYRMVLKKEEPKRVLYLAIPANVYKDFFMLPFTQDSVQTNQLKLIIYDTKTEEIMQWLT
ncbi:XisH family protein [Candidatus Parabeggiatoa sp. HSG14]|uniref:XisH family protein n=1 Tax=Candidatus Parabeggiatoa sp. HSG14 TaxID=3055593 RepID=UPI0025A7A37A|nr:XisH family protein [Thiotrichales bacterium HSG14]